MNLRNFLQKLTGTQKIALYDMDSDFVVMKHLLDYKIFTSEYIKDDKVEINHDIKTIVIFQ